MQILEENVRWHLEAFASELFIYQYFVRKAILARIRKSKLTNLTLILILATFWEMINSCDTFSH